MNFQSWFVWTSAPTQLDRIELALQLQGIKFMTAMENLTNAITHMSTSLASENNLLDHLAQTVRDLAAQLAAANTTQDPAIQAAADQLVALANTADARVAADTQAELPIDPVPEPAPSTAP